jgi:hypothetical protein
MGLDQSFYLEIHRNEFYKDNSSIFTLQNENDYQLILNNNYQHYLDTLKLFDISELSPSDSNHTFSYTLSVEFAYLRKCWPVHFWIKNNYLYSDTLDPYNDSFHLSISFLTSLKQACDTVILDNSLASQIFKSQSLSSFDYDDTFINKITYLSQKISIFLNLQNSKTVLLKYSYSC